jgi:hypothetical protein
VENQSVNHEPGLAFFIVASTLICVLGLIFFVNNLAAPAVEPSNVRISNETGTLLQNVRVNGVAYGDIGIGQVTRYQYMKVAYRFAHVQLVMAGKEVDLRPEDYVGENPLGKGRFTYKIAKGDRTYAGSIEVQAARDSD